MTDANTGLICTRCGKDPGPAHRRCTCGYMICGPCLEAMTPTRKGGTFMAGKPVASSDGRYYTCPSCGARWYV